jgi:hypothetical protein
MPDPLARRVPVLAFLLLAPALLVMALRWHVPMMLWDHLDLVPLLASVREHGLGRELLALHGGHWHAAAYVLLLLTTWLSGGQPWLDSVASWLLLCGFAVLVAQLVRESQAAGGAAADSRWWWLVIALALGPGHLANLQWGWQVAVFSCLLGVAATIHALTRDALGLRQQLVALAATGLALASFATAIALVPTALVLIALRRPLPPARRWLLAAPWLLLGLGLAAFYGRHSLHEPSVSAGIGTLLRYGLNFTGAGIARFATTVAPWLAAAALVAVAVVLPRLRTAPQALPWLGYVLFAAFAAGSVALGRAGPFGAEHAFASRYVSFSLLFWLGLVGLLLTTVRPGRWLHAGLGVVLAFTMINSVHMARRAAQVGADARATAATIRASHPAVDEQVLAAIYFDQPEVARERLQMLQRWGYPPFDERMQTPTE